MKFLLNDDSLSYSLTHLFTYIRLLKLGKLQSCAQRWGWASITDWLSTSSSITSATTSYSHVSCAHDVKTSTFCRFQNVTLDFSKVKYMKKSRTFEDGFFNIFAEEFKGPVDMDIPGLKLHTMSREQAVEANQQCHVFESRPVFLLSNDDIYNLGHYSDDLISMWHMLVLAGRDSRRSVLLNMDGFREGGAAGLQPHRLMEASDPDKHGPYAGYYESWFGEIWRAHDFQDRQQRVCFSELYLKPHPGVPWFWNDWGRVNECSEQAPSPLYQSFNLFMRQRWLDAYGPLSLANPGMYCFLCLFLSIFLFLYIFIHLFILIHRLRGGRGTCGGRVASHQYSQDQFALFRATHRQHTGADAGVARAAPSARHGSGLCAAAVRATGGVVAFSRRVRVDARCRNYSYHAHGVGSRSLLRPGGAAARPHAGLSGRTRLRQPGAHVRPALFPLRGCRRCHD